MKQTMFNRQPLLLVVDDMPDNLELLARMFKEEGYQVRLAPSGALALKAVQVQAPDLILLDINMPEMNGFEVCKRLKEQEQWRQIPIIFISALGDAKAKLEAFEAGGVDYVTKPFQFTEVEARVRTHLQLHFYQENLEQMVAAQVKEIADTQLSTIFALAKLAESRDDETGDHLERVRTCCRLLAEALLQLPECGEVTDDSFVRTMEQASSLHDIGKVGIPDGILLKPGRLTPTEFEKMKEHTLIGAHTLESVRERYPHNMFLTTCIEIVRWHHERWDGAGYPDGLNGGVIPVSARIMAVADVYDALRSRRCYKAALSHEESRKILQTGSGSQFDPLVIKAFLMVEAEIVAAYEAIQESNSDYE